MPHHQLLFDPFKLIRVAVIGVGGTGSHLVTLLTEVHKCVTALGGKGLHVVAFDGDEVSETNVLRQNYARSDIGRNKATTLMTRVNMACSLNWQGMPRMAVVEDLNNRQPSERFDVVFTCVDSRQARRALGKEMTATYWVDTGNAVTTGQIMLSQPGVKGAHLPTPLEEYAQALKGKDDDSPSCSALEALTRQDLMVNREVAVKAAGLLWRLLRNGRTRIRGVVLDAESGISVPLPVSAEHVPEYKTPPVGLIPAAPVALPVPAPKKRTRKAKADAA